MNTEGAYESLFICPCLGLICDCPESDSAPSTLAVMLDVAMACDDNARAEYARIYGMEWVPLCEAYYTNKAIRDASPVRGPGTMVGHGNARAK